jgi:hypothetical protein
MIRFRYLAVGVISGFLSAAAAIAEICDPGLLGSDRSPIAYQLQGDRCEGIFKLEVNSELVRLVSLVESFEEFDTSQPENLAVEWSPPPLPGALRMRSAGLEERSFYRMDTEIAAGRRSYSWPLDILDRLDLTREKVGVLGWIAHTQSPDPDFDKVYLPLRLWQKTPAPRRGVYEVVFIPEVKLKEVFLTIVPAGLDARPAGRPLAENRPLEYGYYPAKTPVVFELEGLAASGYYQVGLTMLDTVGGSLTYRFLLFHEAPKK